MEKNATQTVEGRDTLRQELAALEEAHAEQEATLELQELIIRSTSARELMQLVTDYLRTWLECDAVGIRLREGEDFPYYETNGFSASFVLAENSLCATDSAGELVRDSAGNPALACMCGNIICGRFDPSKPFFTDRGSFWTNSTTELLATTTEADRQSPTRNRCNTDGYESLGLFSLRVGTEPYGLLQINAKRKGLFSPTRVACLERLSGILAVALAQRRTEEALRENEERFRDIAESMSDWIWEVDADAVYTRCSAKVGLILGYREDEIIGKTPFDLMPSDEAERVGAVFGEIAKHRRPFRDLENWNLAKDGRRVCFLTSGTPILGDDGELLGYRGVDKDITERKRVERDRHLTQFSVDNAAESIARIAPDGRFLYVNEKFCHTLGYSREEMLRMSVPDIDPDFDSDRWPDHWEQLKREGSLSFESRHRTKDGMVFPVEIRAKYFEHEGQEYNFAFARDITERKRAEKALERESRMRTALLDNIPGCIALILKKGTREIVASNKFARELGAVPGQTCFETCAMRDDNCPFCLAPKLWQTGQPRRIEVEYRGTWYEGIWEPLSEDLYVHYIFDITERKRVEDELAKHRDHLEELVEERTRQLEESRAQLQRAQRLASVGTLAAGIAHEINNPLGLILMSAQRALEKSGDPKALETSLHSIKDDVKRCARIVKSVLQFSRDESSDKWPVDVNECVRRAEEFTREHARLHGVQVQFVPASNLPAVVANPTELEQAFVNLIHNAVDACSDGQTVTLGTVRGPASVQITIVDHGRGMTAEERERAFDPFYTTRQLKGGTGLGLSIVHGIITGQGGTIDIDSQPGKGTRIIVELPVEVAENSKE